MPDVHVIVLSMVMSVQATLPVGMVVVDLMHILASVVLAAHMKIAAGEQFQVLAPVVIV